MAVFCALDAGKHDRGGPRCQWSKLCSVNSRCRPRPAAARPLLRWRTAPARARISPGLRHPRWLGRSGPARHIHGQTWYVGTCGITVVLVDTGAGLVLIDTGPQEAVPHVLASIRALGFDPKRIRWILSTHEHFDHVRASPRCSGKPAPTCPGRSSAMRCAAAGPCPDDPQAAGAGEKPMEPVKVTRPA